MASSKRILIEPSSYASTENLSRYELLAWVNEVLQSDFTLVEEMCTGAAYCNFLELLVPGTVAIKRVKWDTILEHEYIQNYKILQNAFNKLNLKKVIPVDVLVKGKFQTNLEFLQWFKKFFDANNSGRQFDALAVRGGAYIGNTNKVLSPRRRPDKRNCRQTPSPFVSHSSIYKQGTANNSTTSTTSSVAGASSVNVPKSSVLNAVSKAPNPPTPFDIERLELENTFLNRNIKDMEKQRNGFYQACCEVQNLCAPFHNSNFPVPKIVSDIYDILCEEKKKSHPTHVNGPPNDEDEDLEDPLTD